MATASLRAPPLPRHWHPHAKSAVLFAIGLAHHAIACVRGACADSPIARVRLAAECDRLHAELAMLREELRIKDARMARIPASRRPHYPPPERMAILSLKAARGWSCSQTARRFFLTAVTISSWMKRLDHEGPDALVQLPTPVNRFPDFVGHIVRKLKLLGPAMGRRRIADTLARAGLHLSATTVQRLLHKPAPPPDKPRPSRAAAPSNRVVTAKRPHHVWHVDLTTMPTASGFWIPLVPFAFLQRWPFAWWIAVVVDHFSRAVVGFEVFREPPTEARVVAMLSRLADANGPPKYIVTDRGVQFGSGYRAWCAGHGVTPRFGAIGQHGSIAVVERFIRSLKDEGLRPTLVPFSLPAMSQLVARYAAWYSTCRPHRALGGATPDEMMRGVKPAILRPRLEPRARYPARAPCASPQRRIRGKRGVRLRLVVAPFEGASHLPVVELRRAA